MYLSSKRGGPPLVLLFFRVNIFRANGFLLELSFSGGGEFSTWVLERRWIVRFKCNKLTIKRYQKRTTVGNTLRVFRVNKLTHIIKYNGKRIATKRNGLKPRSLRCTNWLYLKRWFWCQWNLRFHDVRGLTSRTLHRPKNLILTKSHWHEIYLL